MGPSEEGSAAKRVFAGTTYLGTVTNSDMDPEEIAANAELWADAPRMLEVLRALCTHAGIPQDGTQDVAQAAFDEADAILEKHGG
jgi:hypothetical protein